MKCLYFYIWTSPKSLLLLCIFLFCFHCLLLPKFLQGVQKKQGGSCSEGMGVWAGKTSLELILHTTPLNTNTVAENLNPVLQMGRLQSQEIVNKGYVLVSYFINTSRRYWCCFMLRIKLQECCEGCLACIRVWVMSWLCLACELSGGVKAELYLGVSTDVQLWSTAKQKC